MSAQAFGTAAAPASDVTALLGITEERFAAQWQAWNRERVRVVTAPHGIASLAHTHWLSETPTAYDGLPGLWHQRGELVVASDVGPDLVPFRSIASANTNASAKPSSIVARSTVILAPTATGEFHLAAGEELSFHGALVRAFARDGALAVRVFDPDAASRTSLRSILSYPPSTAWLRQGNFSADDQSVDVAQVDGHVSQARRGGRIELDFDGTAVTLTATRGPAGLHAVFADGSSGSESYRFRFLPISEPADDGTVLVDFNRAYLPPCAFSDQYVCPLPLPGNRWTVPIHAGERLADRAPIADS